MTAVVAAAEMAKRPSRKGRPAAKPQVPPPRELVVFGERLRALRTKAGLTQTELSEKAGLRQTHVSQLERGAVEPRLGTIIALADALGIEPAQLLPRKRQ